MLEHLGYQAIVAGNGETALRAYQAEIAAGGTIFAVLLDWRLGAGMDGMETLRRLRTLNPRIKAILSSGYPAKDQVDSGASAGFSGVIAKPYEMKTLAEAFARLAE